MNALNPGILDGLSAALGKVPSLGAAIRATGPAAAVWVPGIVELTDDYGVSLTATPQANAAAIQAAMTEVTTLGNKRLGYALHLKGNEAGMPYPCSMLTLPSEPLTLYGDSPVLSVLGTTDGTILTYAPAVPPLDAGNSPWANSNATISGIHYRSNMWRIFDIGFTKTDNWSGNTGTGVYFPNWTSGSGNQLNIWMSHCLITNFNGDGLQVLIDGIRGHNYIHDVTADGNAGIGIILPSDTLATEITGSNNANQGCAITGSAVVIVNLKCYANGGNQTGAGIGTAGLSIENGNGGTVVLGYYSQDNDGPGLYLYNAQNVKVQMVADRNCWNDNTVSSTAQAGVIVNGAFGCDIDIVATDSWAGTKANGQLHGVLVQQTDGTNSAFSANAKNRIRVTQTQTYGATNTVLATVDPNSMLDGCQMIVDGVTLPRVKAVSAPGATPSMDSDTFDLYRFTGLAAAITSMTSGLTGTPVDGQSLQVSFTDNGTARAITWGASFESSTVSLPATTVASARLDVWLTWNAVTSKWRCVRTALPVPGRRHGNLGRVSPWA